MFNKIVGLIFVVAILAGGVAAARAELYPATYIVIDVNYEYDYITVQSPAGYTYEWIETEDYKKGDLVSAIVDDMETELIYDDEIIQLRYAGTVNMFDKFV